ncbi:hypothetical protein PSCICE_29590 [Pseudomonas cichorii]|nr:hypothetical protein PSCICE_29590 [Pseudomonas cichorii]
MAKPAARITDPTSCPIPGHGTKAIASGSPDVFLDGLAAATTGKMDQKIPDIQIDALLMLIQALTSVFRITTLGGHREFPMQAGEGKNLSWQYRNGTGKQPSH